MFFKWLINIIVILDTCCVVLHVEFVNHPILYYETVISNVILLIYILELAIKASDNRKALWKNKWDVFNLVITVATALVEITILFLKERGYSSSSLLEQIRVIRIVRVLKLAANVSNLRVIIKTISVAFKPMIYIGILMLMGLGLFAIVGVSLFGTIKGIQDTDKAFRFSSLSTCIAILYQIMTLDNWTVSYMELISLIDPIIVTIFYVLWICLGAFIFKNVFVGVLVNNFARVDQKLRQLRQEQQKANKFGKLKQKLQGELKKVQDKIEKTSSSNVLSRNTKPSIHEGYLSPNSARTAQITTINFPTKQELNDWDEIIKETRPAILTQDTQVKWPRKTAFHYLQVLSALQEDLEEYYEITKMANQMIVEILQE